MLAAKPGGGRTGAAVKAGMNTFRTKGEPMPRCCCQINDPATGAPLIYCEIDTVDAAAGQAAAVAAAEAAYAAANGGAAPPAGSTTTFTLPGKLTHTTIDLGSV